MSAGTESQIKIATDFLLSAVGPGAPELANEELRRAFRGGDFDQTRYWRAVKDRSIQRLVDEGLLESPARSGDNNVIHVDFGRGPGKEAASGSKADNGQGIFRP